MDPSDWWSLLDKGGLIAGLLILLALVFTGKLHTDREFRAMEKDRDEWRLEARRGPHYTERAVTVAEKVEERAVSPEDLEALIDARVEAVTAERRKKPRPR